MQLERHLLVLWRFRAVVAGGVALGILLAVLAAYQVRWDGGVLPSLAARGEEQWSAGSRLLVTQQGFPEGRVTLPGLTSEQSPDQQQTNGTDDKQGIQYADPARFASLAALYSSYARSDLVRSRIAEHPEPDQIQAVPLDLNGSGDQFLPIVEITTTDTTERGAQRLNDHTLKALRGLLSEEQARANIPADSRVRLDTLNEPRTQLLSGHSYTGSILAFFLCVLAAVALAHILESLLPPAPVVVSRDDGEPVAVNGHNGTGSRWPRRGSEEPEGTPEEAEAVELERRP